MSAFAKIFEHPEYGQILCVARGNAKNKPELVWSIKPDGYGVCDVAIGFDGEDGWDKMDKAFAMADTEMAGKIAKSVCAQVLGL